jgi:hypothetical protein
METKSFEIQASTMVKEPTHKTIKVSTIGTNGRPQSEVYKSNCVCTEAEQVQINKYRKLAQEVEDEEFFSKWAMKQIEDNKSKKVKSSPNKSKEPSLKTKESKAKLESKKSSLLSMKKDILKIKCSCWAEEEYRIWDEKELIYQEGEEYPYHTENGFKYYLGPEGYFTLESSCDTEDCDQPLTENSVLWSENNQIYDPVVDGYYHTYKGKRYFLGEDGNYYLDRNIQTIKRNLALGFGSYYRGPFYEKLHRCDWHGGLMAKDRMDLFRQIELAGNDSPALNYADPPAVESVTNYALVEKGQTLVREAVESKIHKLGDPPNCGVYVYVKHGNRVDVVCYDNCRNRDMENLEAQANTDDKTVAKMRLFAKKIDVVWADTNATFASAFAFVKEAEDNRIRINDLIRKTAGIADDDSRFKSVQIAKVLRDKSQKEYKEISERAEQSWKRKVAKVKEEALNKGGSYQLSGFSYDELSKLPFPSENASLAEKRFYNAVMDYLDYSDDIKEGAVDPALLDGYMTTLLKLDSQIAKDKAKYRDDSFEKILEKEYNPDSDNELEKYLSKLITEYNDEKSEEKKSRLKKEIKELDSELEEELSSDRDFQEGLKNVLVAKNENDISETAHQNYLTTMCQIEKTIFTKANSDYEMKLRDYERDSKELETNIKEKENCQSKDLQNGELMYDSVTKALFSGMWFMEQLKAFGAVKNIKGFTLTEEQPEENESSAIRKIRLENEKNTLAKTLKNVEEKGNNIDKSITKTKALLRGEDQNRINVDYENYKNNQLLAMKASRDERSMGVKQEEGVVRNFNSVVEMKTMILETKQEQIVGLKKAIRMPIAYNKEGPKITKFEGPTPDSGVSMQKIYRLELMKQRAAAIKSPTELKKILASPKTPTTIVASTVSPKVEQVRAASPRREASPRRSAPIRVAPIMNLKPIVKAPLVPPIKTSPTVLSIPAVGTPTVPAITATAVPVVSPPKPRTGITIRIARPRAEVK